MSHIHVRLIAVFLALFIGGGTLMARTPEPVVTQLENGATVVVLENRQSPVVSLRAYIRAGAMHEGEQGRGMTHLLEHLVASGSTTTRTEAEARRVLDAIGAQMNAYTTRDHACYYMTTASRFFDTGLELLADWMMNSSLPVEEFNRELEVIQREMESRRSDPQVILNELMSRTMFKVHPAQYPVLGFRASFRNITRDQVYAYYRATFVPDNLIFVAAGDIDPKEATHKIEQAFSEWERQPVPLYTFPTEPPQLARRDAAREMPISQAYLEAAWRTVPLAHPDLYALDLLSFILSAGDSARLVRQLREERNLVNSIGAWSYTPGYDAGQFAVQATLRPERLAETEKALLEQIARVREELVSEEELRRAKRQKVAEHVFGLQTVEAQAASVAMDILAAHDPNFGNAYVERIQETTAEEIRDVARRYLTEDKLCFVVVQPPITAPAEQTPATTVPEPPPVGEVTRTVLPNGLRLLIKRSAAQPTVSMQAFFLGGVRADPPEKAGLSLFTARMLTRGTERLSAEEIARIFDSMGGSIVGSSGNNALYLSLMCLTENFPQALEVAAQVLREPSFREEEVARLRPLLVAAARRQRDSWRDELSWHFRRNFFERHPYRNTPLGTPEEIERITREDMADFHRSFIVPNNLVLAIFGDVDPFEVTQLVEQHFGPWPERRDLTLPKPESEQPLRESRAITQRASHRLGGVFIGYTGLTVRDEKDRYAMDVLDAIISGIHLPRGWLHEELRGRGLVYEVHAYGFAGLEPGFFGMYAGTEPERVEEVRRIMLEQVARLLRGEISDEDMEAARRICVTADVLERQTNSQQATRVAIDELYGLGLDAEDRYEEGVLAVTADDVTRVAQKYLQHSFTVIMVPEEK